MKRALILAALLPSAAWGQTSAAQFVPPNGLPLDTPLGPARNADGSGVTTFATMLAGVDAALTEGSAISATLPDKETSATIPFSSLSALAFGKPAVGLYHHPVDQTLSGKILLFGGDTSEEVARLYPVTFSTQQGDYFIACYGDASTRLAVTAPVMTTAPDAVVQNGIMRKQITFILKAGDSLRLVAQWVASGDIVYIARLQEAPS